MSEQNPDFGTKLSLALKLLNISRGALAAEARADKSLISRWLRGVVAPRDHNLAALTTIIRHRAPGFTQLSWDLPLAEFAHILGGEAVPEDKPTTPAVVTRIDGTAEQRSDPSVDAFGTPRSRVQSAIEVDRDGQSYTGIYASFRMAFRNTGQIIPDLLIIWRDRERLFFRVFDPSFTHTGEIFILRHQLFFVGEDDQRVDGLFCLILNGVSGQKAFRIDGILMTVTNDRQRTPGAAAVVFQRIADLPEDGAVPAKDLLVAISNRMRNALFTDQLEALAGPEMLAVIRPVIGTGQPDGTMEYLMRRPMDRSIGASEMEMTPGLLDDLKRVRAAFVDEVTGATLGLDFVIPAAQEGPLSARHGTV